MISIPVASARHQLTLWDHRYGASALRGVLVIRPPTPPQLLPVPNFTAWWQGQMRVNNLPRVVTPPCPGCRHGSNSRPLDRKSNTLPLLRQWHHESSMKNSIWPETVYWATDDMPSVIWRCWLGGRKGIWSVKTQWWGAGVVICLEQGDIPNDNQNQYGYHYWYWSNFCLHGFFSRGTPGSARSLKTKPLRIIEGGFSTGNHIFLSLDRHYQCTESNIVGA